MKKFLIFLLPLLLFTFCEGTEGGTNTGKTYNDFAVWSEWLEYKYKNDFGYDSGNLGALKTPITHNMSAEEFIFAKGLNAGWNLGNTYDLPSNPRADTGHYDKLFAGVKAAGFNVLRLPVSWGGQYSSGTINSGWLDQVEQTITAAHTAGLVVFVNTHHDKGFFNLNQSGDSYKADGVEGANYKFYTERFVSVWLQIATRFKDYGDWLLFEPINEPTVTSAQNQTQWDGAAQEYYDVLNLWNQAFVDTVRSTGGNNEKRYLLFKSYAGKLQPSLDPTNNYKIPTDPSGTGKLIYSFHSYIPQPLALEGQNTNWGLTTYTVFTGPFAQAANAYIKKGIPVFMGETGATFHSQRGSWTACQCTPLHTNLNPCPFVGSTTANINRLLCLNALGHEARKFGVLPCLWDNGEATRGATQNNPNGETFALFRRKPAHDNDPNNYGKPIDHTRLNGGSAPASTGGHEMNTSNKAVDDSTFGQKTIDAFIDAINGRTGLWRNQLPAGLYP